MDRWTWLEDLGVRGERPRQVRFAAYCNNDLVLFRHGGCAGSGRAQTAGISSDLDVYHHKQKRWHHYASPTQQQSSSSHVNGGDDVILHRQIWSDVFEDGQSSAAAAMSMSVNDVPAPGRYYHCAMAIPKSLLSMTSPQQNHRSDAVLLVHGGKNEQGNECSDLWCFHLHRSGRGYWRPLDGVSCGVQPPTMFGHKAVLLDAGGGDDLDEGDATWAIVGLVANKLQVGAATTTVRKRSRSTSPVPARGTRAPTHRLEVYTLTHGVNTTWKVVSSATGTVPPPRRDFLLSTGSSPLSSSSPSTNATEDHDTHHHQSAAMAPPTQLILVGGVVRSVQLNDAWMFDMTLGSWREVTFAQRPASSLSLPFSASGLSISALSKGALCVPVHAWLERQVGPLRPPMSVPHHRQPPSPVTGMWLSFSGQSCCCLLHRPRAANTLAHRGGGAAAGGALVADLPPLVEVIPLTLSIESLTAGPFTSHLVAVWVLTPEDSPSPIGLVTKLLQQQHLQRGGAASTPPALAVDEVVALGGVTSSGHVFRMSVTSTMLSKQLEPALQSLRSSLHGGGGHTAALLHATKNELIVAPQPAAPANVVHHDADTQGVVIDMPSEPCTEAAMVSVNISITDEDDDKSLLEDLFD